MRTRERRFKAVLALTFVRALTHSLTHSHSFRNSCCVLRSNRSSATEPHLNTSPPVQDASRVVSTQNISLPLLLLMSNISKCRHVLRTIRSVHKCMHLPPRVFRSLRRQEPFARHETLSGLNDTKFGRIQSQWLARSEESAPAGSRH